jgi:hypothetical protein
VATRRSALLLGQAGRTGLVTGAVLSPGTTLGSAASSPDHEDIRDASIDDAVADTFPKAAATTPLQQKPSASTGSIRTDADIHGTPEPWAAVAALIIEAAGLNA